MEGEIPNESTLSWAEPRHEQAPAPSYAPFLLALGITMAFWGLATSPVMLVAGLLVFAVALALWIRDIAQAWRNSHAREG
jgi:hypothetical protein